MMWFWCWASDHWPLIQWPPSWAPHPWVGASVNNVKSVFQIFRESPWDIVGDAHLARWWMTQSGTVVLWAQSSVVWSHASLAKHWIGWNLRRPPGNQWCHILNGAQHLVNVQSWHPICQAPMVDDGLNFDSHLWQGCYREILRPEMHPDEIEFLSWCEFWLLEIYNAL